MRKPDDAQIVGRFGMMLLSYGQPQAAVAPLQRAGELEPDSFAWLYYLGLAQGEAGHPAEALEALKKALAKKPSFVPLQVKIADALLASGRLGKQYVGSKEYAVHNNFGLLPEEKVHEVHSAFGKLFSGNPVSEDLKVEVYKYAIFLLERPSDKPFAPPPF